MKTIFKPTILLAAVGLFLLSSCDRLCSYGEDTYGNSHMVATNSL